jgi:hypothetical protein
MKVLILAGRLKYESFGQSRFQHPCNFLTDTALAGLRNLGGRKEHGN